MLVVKDDLCWSKTQIVGEPQQDCLQSKCNARAGPVLRHKLQYIPINLVLQEIFHTNSLAHKFGTSCVIEMTGDIDE